MGQRRNREGNSDSKRYFDWLERAYEDLAAAKLLAENDETLNCASFHCQQCIEKALKGYILYRTNTHVDGHNLTWLCRQAVRSDVRFTAWLDESAALNRYYIESRYPADTPFEATAAQVTKVLAMAEDMYKFICREMYFDA